MNWVAVLTLMFASKVGLLLTALPVAFVFFIINIAGSYLIFGGFPGLEQMVRNEQLSVAQFSLVPIPFFVLMGEVLFHTGLAMKSIDAVDAVIRPRARPPRGRGAGCRHDIFGDLGLHHRHHSDARFFIRSLSFRAESRNLKYFCGSLLLRRLGHRSQPDTSQIFVRLQEIIARALNNLEQVIHRRNFLELLREEPL